MRWLTTDNEYIEVTSWDNNVPLNSIIKDEVVAYCEVDWVNSKSGNLIFYYKIGASWNDACSYFASSQSTYSCNLYNYGVDTPSEINNLDLRCQLSNSDKGAIGFSIDHINMYIEYQPLS